MYFNSYIFIFLFLPMALIGYYTLNKWKKFVWSRNYLILISVVFYGYFHVGYLLLLIGSIGMNYGIGYVIVQIKDRKKGFLAGGICANIALLFLFKYYNFFADSLNGWFPIHVPLHSLILPLGISFFTFMQISYLVDLSKGEIALPSFLDYMAYVTFFPHLLSGPIVYYKELGYQMQETSRKQVNYSFLSKGFYGFSIGLCKKVLIADTLGRIADVGFSNISGLDSGNALLVMLAYTLQIYFDFSGYCDMAYGIAMMFGFEMPINFNSPYKARNIKEFWDRWHITLTRFFRKYVYFPLGGNRKGIACMYRNMVIVFLVSGIWHGANWTFLLWGLMHGLALVLYRVGSKQIDKIPGVINWCITFLFVNLTWVFFRSGTIGDAVLFLKQLCSFQFGGIDPVIVENVISIPELETLFIWANDSIKGIAVVLICIFLTLLCVKTKNTWELVKGWKPKFGNLMITMILFVWAVVSLASGGAFLYFNF